MNDDDRRIYPMDYPAGEVDDDWHPRAWWKAGVVSLVMWLVGFLVLRWVL